MLIAVGIALLSAACYAVSAVLQQNQASRHADGPGALVFRLVRQPLWLVAVAATLAGAGLHVAALVFGPLWVVEPPGVTTLVFALAFGVLFSRRAVSRIEWVAAGAVMVGVGTVVAFAPDQGRPVHLALGAIGWQVGRAAVIVLILLGLARFLGRRSAAVIRAAAAATCFGTAAAMARVGLSGMGSFAATALVAAVSAVVGFALAQTAYRDGGLGAPLATLILIDPLVGIATGLVLLGGPVVLNPVHIVLATLGLVVTSAGICVLAGVRLPTRARPQPPPTRTARAGRL